MTTFAIVSLMVILGSYVHGLYSDRQADLVRELAKL